MRLMVVVGADCAVASGGCLDGVFSHDGVWWCWVDVVGWVFR